MQSNKSSWHKLLVLGLVSGALAFACSVGDDDDEGDDIVAGSGGKGGSAGSSTGGTGGSTGGSGGSTGGSGGTAAGTGGTGGSAGAQPIVVECDPTTGTPGASCEPTATAEADKKCEECRQTNCCDLWKKCSSSEPYNACAWGGPDGDGELNCVRRCILKAREDDVVTKEEETACGVSCMTPNNATCMTAISDATGEIYACLKDKCAQDCFGGPLNP